ncbi:MAG: ABC transporter permease [Coriobacteriia bacterium]|nr:ABC transporter permease [Coriobacteriia bacterium]
MKNLMPIITANLRKSKSQAASLLAFALISAMLLNLGLLLMVGFGDFFDQRSEALHAPHYALLEEKRLFSQSQLDYLQGYPGVTEVESEPSLSFWADITYSGGKMPAVFFFVDADSPRQMNDLTMVEGRPPLAKDEVCLPYMFKSGGYGLGDTMVMTLGDKVLRYRITGFTEEIMFGSINNQIYQAYLSKQGYQALEARGLAVECMVVRARMSNPEDSTALFMDCLKEFFYKTEVERADTLYAQSLTYSSVKQLRTSMSGITSVILVVFSGMIVLVSLLVVRFRIRNSIEEAITNIGALKAVGYTGSQLLSATVIQFSSIALVGSVAGIACSYTLLPVVSRTLEQQTALQWQQGFDPAVSAIALASILLAVLVVTWLSARRIRSLQPLTALRQGLTTHNFKKNRFSLDKARGSLTWQLALKSALQSKGQMVMIVLIVTVMSFSAVASLAVYDNLGVKKDTFSQLIGGEIPDAAFVFKTPEDASLVRAAIDKDNNVRKTCYNQDSSIMIGDQYVYNNIVEDFSLLEGAMLYAGRYPIHDNEICLSGTLSSLSGLSIGDTARVTHPGKSADYLVVGLVQSVNNGGIISAMTIEGFLRVQPDFEPTELYVYLIDNELTGEFVDSINSRFDSRLDSSINLKELLDAQLGMYGDIFLMVAIVLVTVTVLVIFLVLYLVLKTVILRQRRELGIQKALGFTTFQLMNQLALYLMPVVVIGVALGGLAGVFGFNSLFVALTRGMGIMTASLPAPLALTVAVCVLMVLLSYAFAMLIAARIRRISAYALVTE